MSYDRNEHQVSGDLSGLVHVRGGATVLRLPIRLLGGTRQDPDCRSGLLRAFKYDLPVVSLSASLKDEIRMPADHDTNSLVDCPSHGKLSYGIVCAHLIDATGKIFFEIPQSEVEEHPWAWCAECDKVIVETNGNQEQIGKKADWRLICLKCFGGITSRNRLEAYIAEVEDDKPEP